MPSFIFGLLCFLPVQDAPPARTDAAAPRAHAAPESLLEVLEDVAFEKERFSEHGITMLEATHAPSPDDVARVSPAVAELMVALGEKFSKRVIERQQNDPQAAPSLRDLLRSRLYAVAHRSLMKLVAAGDPIDRGELVALVLRLRDSGDTGEAKEPLPKLAIPARATEVDPTLSSAHPVLRCIPYVVFAALHEPSLWQKQRAGEREVLITDLVAAGLDHPLVAAAVLRALEPPIDATVALDRDGVRSEHPLAFEGEPDLARRVGFTEEHLEFVSSHADRIERERQSAAERGEPDPYPGDGAYLPGYLEELRRRIRLELLGQNRVAMRIDRPSDLIAVWRWRADHWPWPDLAHAFEGHVEELASGALRHPASAELERLAERAKAGPLSAADQELRRELERRRRIDIAKSTREIADVVQSRMPSDQALALLSKLALRLDRALAERTTSDLIPVDLVQPWTAAFERAPDEAASLLADPGDCGAPWSPGTVAATAACDALSRAAATSPSAAEALVSFAVSAPTAMLRGHAIESATNLTPQQAERVFAASIRDDPGMAAGDRRVLAAEAVRFVRRIVERERGDVEWGRQSLLRVFEAGMWPEKDSIFRDPRHADWAIGTLTPAQLDALDAAGKLPEWAKAARARTRTKER